MIDEQELAQCVSDVEKLLNEWRVLGVCPKACLYATFLSGFLGSYMSLKFDNIDQEDIDILAAKARVSAEDIYKKMIVKMGLGPD